MQTTRTLALSFLFSCATSPLLFAQTPAASPAAGTEPAQPRQSSMFGYAFQQINPGDRDYGAALTSARQAVAAQTIDSLYFWSNCATLTLLAGMTGFSLLQIRSSAKKERIASALIAQLWNGRVSDKIEIERRTAEYNALVEKHDSIVERSLTSGSNPASGNGRRSVEKPRIEIQQTAPVEAAAEQPLPARVNEARETPEVVRNAGRSVSVVPAPIASLEAQSGRTMDDGEAVLGAIAKPSSAQPTISRNTSVISNPVQTSPAQLEPKSEGTALDAAESTRMSQEIIRLKNQVDAFRNTERNLKERLNRQEQFIESVKGIQAVEDKS